MENKHKINKEIPNKAGRVIDLRKKDGINFEENVLDSSSFSFSFKNPFRSRKMSKNDFLKHYLLLEKKEEFIEEEIMREYLDDETEDFKRGKLNDFFGTIEGAECLCRLPFFVFKLFWKLVWRFKVSKKISSLQLTTQDKKEEIELKNTKKKLVKEKRFSRVLFIPVANPVRQAFLFAVAVLAVMIPLKAMSHFNIYDLDSLKGRVLGVSQRAVGNWGSAANSVSAMNLSSAVEDFGRAKEDFSQAKEELNKINSLLFEIGKLVPDKKIRLASYSKDFMDIGESASSLGSSLALGADVFLSFGQKDLSSLIDEFLHHEKEALAEAKKINEKLSAIDQRVLPSEHAQLFSSLKESSADLEIILSGLASLTEKLNIFLGAEEDKRYLFVFQNNSEMRASGGFIGSFALVDISRGRIKNIEVPGGGSYDMERDLKQFIISPQPLWLVNPRWHFWDSNWWPDWKKSAQKISWFYEKSGGPTVDGVISFTPTVLERILSVIGPMDMTETHGIVVDSDNLWLSLRDVIEKEKEDDLALPPNLAEKKPKKVIGDLVAKIMEEAPKRLNKETLSSLVLSLNHSLDDKQILFYFSDKRLQQEAESRNWAGRLRQAERDYLSVVNTNIAGGKSDGKMEEVIEHQAEILEDGSVINTVLIKKIHNGVRDEAHFGVRNVNWLRVYVPLGSELLEANGFRGPDPIYFEYPEDGWEKDIDASLEDEENVLIDRDNQNTKIYRDSGKTVFANWVMVDPGQEVIIRLKYKLPFKLEKKNIVPEKKSLLDSVLDKFIKDEKKDFFVYSLMVQKQPGMLFSRIESVLKVNNSFKNIWSYPENINDASGWSLTSDLDSDKYWALILEKRADDLGNYVK